MKENIKDLTISIVISFIGSAFILMIGLIIGFLLISRSIDNKSLNNYNHDCNIKVDLGNKDFLNDMEAAEYLGISWEALITVVEKGHYKGNMIKETVTDGIHETTYIFPREELKVWFNEYMKTNKVIEADSNYLQPKY